MKTWQGILFGTFLGLSAAAVMLLVVLPPRGEPIVLPPTPSPAAIAVYVSGAVNRPGVVYIPRQSRVYQAIEAAGGFSTEADTDLVNLAARVNDGERVTVLSRSASSTKTALTSTAVAFNPKGSSVMVTPAASYPINLNTATQEELETLPNIGPTKAVEILAYRQKIGQFLKIEDILNVPGIGPTTFEKIKELITLEN